MNYDLLLEIIARMAMYAVLGLTGLNLVFWLKAYVRKKRHAYMAGGIYALVTVLLYVIPVNMDSWIAYMIATLVSFLLLLYLDRRNMEQKIFLYLTFFILRYLVSALVLEITRFVDQKAYTYDLLQNGGKAIALYLTISQVVWASLIFFVLYASIYFLNHIYKRKWENISVGELFCLLIPQAAVLFVRPLLSSYYDLYNKCIEQGVVNENITANGYTFIYMIVSYLTIMVLIIVHQQFKEREEEICRQQLVESQMADMKQHIRQVEELYQDIRALRHDMGNHIQTMEHLMVKDNQEEVSDYIQRLKKDWQQAMPEVRTGNPVTDVIIQGKMREAEKRKISFQCDFHFPIQTNIDAFDVGVILNNALNNCLESANGDQPWIQLTSSRKGYLYFISVKNSFHGTILRENDSILPVSLKGKEGHGYGLLNIQKVAKSYLGDILLEQENGSVTLQIMMQTEEKNRREGSGESADSGL